MKRNTLNWLVVAVAFSAFVVGGCGASAAPAADEKNFKEHPKNLAAPTADQLKAATSGPGHVGPLDGGDGKKSAPPAGAMGAPPTGK